MDPITVAITTLAGLAATGAIGAVKKQTTILDGKIGAWIKPVQPAIATGLSIALPWISNALHLSAIPDAQLIANAPASAIIGITVAELVSKLGKKK